MTKLSLRARPRAAWVQRASCALLPAVLLSLAACPGTLDDIARFRDAGGDAPVCADVETGLFAHTCATAGCHAAVEPTVGLDLASPGVRARLTGHPASGGSALLIDPAHPEMSALYTKLTANPPFGSRMPLSGALDDATIACVLAWIEEAPAGSTTGSPDASPDTAPTTTPDGAPSD